MEFVKLQKQVRAIIRVLFNQHERYALNMNKRLNMPYPNDSGSDSDNDFLKRLATLDISADLTPFQTVYFAKLMRDTHHGPDSTPLAELHAAEIELPTNNDSLNRNQVLSVNKSLSNLEHDDPRDSPRQSHKIINFPSPGHLH